jgi:hypothetical protein
MKTDKQILDEVEKILNQLMDQMYNSMTEVSSSYALGAIFGTIIQRGRD